MPRRVFTSVACLLIALWLPAVLHCAVEAAGVLDGADCCGKPAATAGTHCAADHSAALEAARSRNDDLGSRPVALPAVAALRPAAVVAIVEPGGEIQPVGAAPPGLIEHWRTRERVVAPARAP